MDEYFVGKGRDTKLIYLMRHGGGKGFALESEVVSRNGRPLITAGYNGIGALEPRSLKKYLESGEVTTSILKNIIKYFPKLDYKEME